MEEKPWYETEEDRLYEEAVNSIKSAVENSVPFDEAAAKLDVKDEGLKAAIVDDALKLLIAEMHFMKRASLDEVANALKVPLTRVEDAKKQMLEEVEQAAIEKYKESLGQEGNA
jgi:hypothetical protein